MESRTLVVLLRLNAAWNVKDWLKRCCTEKVAELEWAQASLPVKVMLAKHGFGRIGAPAAVTHPRQRFAVGHGIEMDAL
jgi:hypothetical protein